MKKYIINLSIIVILATFTSCEKELIIFDSSMNVIGFCTAETIIKENVGVSSFKIYMGAPNGAEETVVTFSVDTTGLGAAAAKEGIDFTLSALSVPVTVGENLIGIINPVDNNEFTGNKKFYLVIQSNSKNYRISAQKRFLVVLSDDEHPLKNWLGTYRVEAASYGEPGNWDELWTVVTSPVEGDVTKLSLKGIGKPEADPIIASFNPVDMTIIIEPGQSLGDPYGYGPISVFKGTPSLEFNEDDKLTGVLQENGNFIIDRFGLKITDGDYAGPYDVFKTTWAKQ